MSASHQLFQPSRSKPPYVRFQDEKDEKLIAKTDFTINESKLIGVGSVASVYIGTYQGREVAIKKFNSESINTVRDMINEWESLSASFPSQYVVEPVAYCILPPTILMEYVKKGSLYHLLQTSPSLKWNKKITIAHDIALGLLKLLEHHIIHRDIKSDNILITEDFHAKLTDFGLAGKTYVLQNTLFRMKGSFGSMAPECVIHELPFIPEATDVYSLGVLMVELAIPLQQFEDYINCDYQYHKAPIDDMDAQKKAAMIRHNTIQSIADNKATKWPRDFKALAQECLHLDPHKRPTMLEIENRLNQMLIKMEERQLKAASNEVVVKPQAVDSLKDKPTLWQNSKKSPPKQEVVKKEKLCCTIL